MTITMDVAWCVHGIQISLMCEGSSDTFKWVLWGPLALTFTALSSSLYSLETLCGKTYKLDCETCCAHLLNH